MAETTIDPEEIRRLLDPARHSDLALATAIDAARPRIANVVPETGATPNVGGSLPVIGSGLQPIGAASTSLPTLSAKQQKGLPNISPGVAPGSSAFYENKLAKLEAPSETPTTRLGRVGHALSRIGNVALDVAAPGIASNIPGTDMFKRAEIHAIEPELAAAKKEESEEPLKKAQVANLESEIASRKNAKLLSGEENVRTDKDGNRERAYELPNGSIEWRPEGAAEPDRLTPISGEPTPQFVYGKPKTQTEDEQFVQKYLADNKLPDTAENRLAAMTERKNGAPIGDADAKQLTTQIANVLKGTGIDASGYAITAKSTRGEASEALKAAQAAANEQRTRTAPEAAQNRKDTHTMGYALDASGKLVYTNKAEADKRGVTFEEMKPDAVNKDRQSLRQLNDIQKNISEYRKAIDAFQGPIENTAAMRRIMAGVNASDVEKMGYLTMGAAMNMLEHGEVSNAWNKLNGEEKAAIIGYLRAKGAMIAYNRVVSGSARTNKEALEVEWANLPSPDVGAEAGDKQMDAMQQNLDQVNAGYPTNLPGMRVPEKVKEGVESGGGATHNFSVNGVEYKNVTEEDYKRAKKLKGFKE